MARHRRQPPAVPRRPRRQPVAPQGAARRLPPACGGRAPSEPALIADPGCAPSATSCGCRRRPGLQVVTDGEFRRSSYWGRFVERCQGFAIKPAVFKFRDDHGHEVDFTATYAAAKLARTQPLATDEFAFLRSVTKVTAKITMPAPSTMHFYRCTDFADPAVYADARGLLCRSCRTSTAQEIADLAKAGCRYIQLDEVAVAMLCDPAIRDKVAAAARTPTR